MKRDWVQLQRVTRAGLGLALGVSLFGGVVGGVGAAPVSSDLAPGSDPRTDGITVVYEAMNDGTWDVYGASVSDHVQYPLAVGESQALYPDVAGDFAVWQETNADGDYDIVGKHLIGGERFTVANSDRMEVYPAVADGWVAFASVSHSFAAAGTAQLQVRNLNTMAPAATLDEVSVGDGGSGGFLRPAISGKRVAWVRMEQIGDHLVHWQIKTQRIGETNATVVAEEDLDIGGPLSALATPSLDVSGDILVYTADLRLQLVNLSTGERAELAAAQSASYHPAQNPTTDGRYVYFQDYWQSGNTQDLIAQTQHGTLLADISGYDLQSGSLFPAVSNQRYNADPAARGGYLTYERKTNIATGEPEVYVVPVAATLPTAPQLAPGGTSPNWSYFPQTQHYLSFGFQDFWKQSGGLPVFGYPLTEEFSERNADTDSYLTVQYLERQRYEYHPEFAGTPYETELGRLGAEDAAKRGLLGTQPFKALSESQRPGVPCQFFAATGHFVCGNFLNYWQSQGLNFGDPGISYRESLALFGYPISEPFVDPDSGLTVQYFERARFEWHPENSAPYNLLLGRLAADTLAQRGW